MNSIELVPFVLLLLWMSSSHCQVSTGGDPIESQMDQSDLTCLVRAAKGHLTDGTLPSNLQHSLPILKTYHGGTGSVSVTLAAEDNRATLASGQPYILMLKEVGKSNTYRLLDAISFPDSFINTITTEPAGSLESDINEGIKREPADTKVMLNILDRFETLSTDSQNTMASLVS